MTDVKEQKKTIKSSEGYQDPVKLYLRDVGKAPLLTHKQEIEISQTIEQAKQAIIDRLFGIPLTINTVTTWIESALASAQDAVDRFDIDLPTDDIVPAEFMDQLTKVKDLCEQYKLKINDSVIKIQLTTAFNDLPLNPASLTHLMDQVIAYNRQVTSIDGDLVRLAESCGIDRLEWLSLYMQNDNLAYLYAQDKPTFKNLMSKHGAKIAECDIKITEIQSKTGMTIKELRQVVKDLRRHAKIKEEAIQRMVTSNLRLVVSIAKRYNQNNPTTILDLAQEGNIGLIKAVEKFKWQLGFRFSTYATWWIRQAIIKATSEQNKIIRVPSHVIDSIKRINKAIKDHVNTKGYEPSDAELAAICGMDEDKVKKMLQVAKDPISLETPVGDEEEGNIGNYIEDTAALDTIEKINQDDITKVISNVLSHLNPREERVIRMRFGIGTMDEATLEEIGKKFNVTRERVRQIEAKALQRLKSPQRLKDFESIIDP
jgi:RNA polymerase primary sigma factor